MQVGLNGKFPSRTQDITTHGEERVAAIADKLGVEFALIHRERTRKSDSTSERMEVLVGDVRDKVPSCRFIEVDIVVDTQTGRNPGG